MEPAWTPQIISALSEVRVTDIIAGPCAAHSFFITDNGQLFGLGNCAILMVLIIFVTCILALLFNYNWLFVFKICIGI